MVKKMDKISELESGFNLNLAHRSERNSVKKDVNLTKDEKLIIKESD